MADENEGAPAAPATSELQELRDLIVQHAESIGGLFDDLAAKLGDVERRLADFESAPRGEDVGKLRVQVAMLHSRLSDALVRLGVETSSQAEALAPKGPAPELVWDGCNFVPKPPESSS